jgi:hypothetical protein
MILLLRRSLISMSSRVMSLMEMCLIVMLSVVVVIVVCRCLSMFVDVCRCCRVGDVVGWMHRAGNQSWKTGFL